MIWDKDSDLAKVIVVWPNLLLLRSTVKQEKAALFSRIGINQTALIKIVLSLEMQRGWIYETRRYRPEWPKGRKSEEKRKPWSWSRSLHDGFRYPSVGLRSIIWRNVRRKSAAQKIKYKKNKKNNSKKDLARGGSIFFYDLWWFRETFPSDDFWKAVK